jgi:hypothetical protein
MRGKLETTGTGAGAGVGTGVGIGVGSGVGTIVGSGVTTTTGTVVGAGVDSIGMYTVDASSCFLPEPQAESIITDIKRTAIIRSFFFISIPPEEFICINYIIYPHLPQLLFTTCKK